MKLKKILIAATIGAVVIAVPFALAPVLIWGIVAWRRRLANKAVLRDLYASPYGTRVLEANARKLAQDDLNAQVRDQLAEQRQRRSEGRAHAEATAARIASTPVVGSRGRHAR